MSIDDPNNPVGNTTIRATDQRIVYRGHGWTNQVNGQHFFTSSPDAGFTFSFNGTAIYYHATINDGACAFLASIDSQKSDVVDASLNAPKNLSSPIPAIIYSKTGLLPNVTHTLNISYFSIGSQNGPYLEIYNLTYTRDNMDDTLNDTSPSSSSPSSGSSPNGSSPATSTSSSSSHPSKGGIIGGVVGGILGVILIILLILMFNRRRRHHHRSTLPTPTPISPDPSVTPYPAPGATPLMGDSSSFSAGSTSASPPPISTTMRSKSSAADLVSQNPPTSMTTTSSGHQHQNSAHTGLTPTSARLEDDPPPVYDGRRLQ